jgi:hypothetical protein
MITWQELKLLHAVDKLLGVETNHPIIDALQYWFSDIEIFEGVIVEKHNRDLFKLHVMHSYNNNKQDVDITMEESIFEMFRKDIFGYNEHDGKPETHIFFKEYFSDVMNLQIKHVYTNQKLRLPIYQPTLHIVIP